jgi:hypothetical protein
MMLLLVLEIIIAVCGIITIVALIMVIRERLLINRLSNFALSELPVKKTTYCKMVLDWCHENLGNSNKSKPTLTLKYYPHQKLAGVFMISSNECQIYIQNHQTLRQITNTVIHEYVHSLQKSKTFDKMYEKHQREIGYEMNPFEIEARHIAKKHERECLSWVCAQISQS